MFYDRATIEVKAGKGGDGCVAFRREKHVAKGGPDGGDGGNGGDVVLRSSPRLRDLSDFQRRQLFKAGKGRPGEGSKRHGRNGDNAIVEVPLGTQIRDMDGNLQADLVGEGQQFVAARGGEGGRGNAHFATSTRRTPRFAELGLSGEQHEYRLELKLLADAGLLGFPNAGKSSLLRLISHAKPKVADYPFTTTMPMLGTVEDVDTHQQFTVADIPGLLEGASQGVGLGDDFLMHLERTSILIHMVDVGGYYEREPLENFKTINRELADFSPELAARPQVVALNKTDLVSDQVSGELAEVLAREVKRRCLNGDPAYAWLVQAADGDPEQVDAAVAVFEISAATGAGVQNLLRTCLGLITGVKKQESLQSSQTPRGRTIYRPLAEDDWRIESEGETFRISGKAVEKLVERTDFNNEHAVAFLQEKLERMGISEALSDAGVQPGEDVIIGKMVFEFW